MGTYVQTWRGPSTTQTCQKQGTGSKATQKSCWQSVQQQQRTAPHTTIRGRYHSNLIPTRDMCTLCHHARANAHMTFAAAAAATMRGYALCTTHGYVMSSTHSQPQLTQTQLHSQTVAHTAFSVCTCPSPHTLPLHKSTTTTTTTRQQVLAQNCCCRRNAPSSLQPRAGVEVKSSC